MKFVIVFCVVIGCAAVLARPEDAKKYTTKYDNVDLDAIIKNDRLLRSYVDCLLNKRKCTKDGEELKRLLPDALKNKCANCSDFQKRGAKKMVNHLIKNKRAWWNELEVTYDPEGTYRKSYEDEAKKEGIELD